MKKSSCVAGALILGLSVGLGTVSTANAQLPGSGPSGSGQIGGSADVVRESGNAGQFATQSGRLALARSQNGGVRAYAGQAITDADEMIDRVAVIGTADAGAPMPAGVSSDQQVMLDRLARLSGAAFDRAYLQAEIEVGQGLRLAFSTYGATGGSSPMRIYAAKAATDCDARILQARTVAGSL